MWGECAVEEVWRRYFAALAELAASGHVDVLAHPDLTKIFGRRPERRHRVPGARGRRARDLDRRPAQAGRRAVSGPGVPRGRSLPITLASDAHVPQNVGRDFDRALDLARAAGYETVTVFENRPARQEPLG